MLIMWPYCAKATLLVSGAHNDVDQKAYAFSLWAPVGI